MKLNYYTTYDKVSQAFAERPYLAPNDAAAVRIIKNSQRADKQLNINADDYELYCVGSWDNTTGEMLSDLRKVMDMSFITFDNNGMEVR